MTKSQLHQALRLLDQHRRWSDAHRSAVAPSGIYNISVAVCGSDPLILDDYDANVPDYVADAVVRFAAEKLIAIQAELDALGVEYPAISLVGLRWGAPEEAAA